MKSLEACGDPLLTELM